MLKREPTRLDLKKNLTGYYLAIAIIFLGYVLLAIGGADSFPSRTLGPIVIGIGFLVAVPAALLTGGKTDDGETAGKSATAPPRRKKDS